MTPVNSYTINNFVYSKQLRIMAGVFLCSIPVVYQYTSIHCDISYTIIGSLYEVVYCIRNVHYTSIRLYEYPLIRVSAAP